MAGRNSTTEPLMQCANCETTQSWRWRRAKDTPSRAANNVAQYKSGMKQLCQFSLWRATPRNQSEPLNKERLESSCLKQDGTVPTGFILVLDGTFFLWGPVYAVPSGVSHLCQFHAVWNSEGKAKFSLREQRLPSSRLKTSCLSCGNIAQW